MLIDQQDVRVLLQGLIYRLVGKTALVEDLMQEALIHLWREESQNPGQTQSWYIQSCRFRIIDYLRKGRSVDFGGNHRNELSVGEEILAEQSDEHVDSPLESASARDLLINLVERLSSTERSILGFLADDFSSVEISEKLGISHQSVSKHRKHIAHLAAQLGATPPRNSSATDSKL